MATSEELTACLPSPPVDLSSGNALKDIGKENTASSKPIPDGLLSTPCQVNTVGYERHANQLEGFRSEPYVSDTDAEELYLTETELESNSGAEKIEVTEDPAGPQAGIDVREVSLLDRALTGNKDSGDIAVDKLISAVATSSCSPTELDSSLSLSESIARTESTSTSPSTEHGRRNIHIRVKSRSRSRTDSVCKGVLSPKGDFRTEVVDYTCDSRADSESVAQ